jgi:hypothetical protein
MIDSLVRAWGHVLRLSVVEAQLPGSREWRALFNAMQTQRSAEGAYGLGLFDREQMKRLEAICGPRAGVVSRVDPDGIASVRVYWHRGFGLSMRDGYVAGLGTNSAFFVWPGRVLSR